MEAATTTPEEWDRLNAAARDRCADGDYDGALADLEAATGIRWADVATAELPAIPAVRDLDGMTSRWPRRLRRPLARARARALRTERVPGAPVPCVVGDYDGLLEILGVIHDAELERRITGVDRLLQYLEHLASLPFGSEVLAFVVALHTAVTGNADIDSAISFLLYASGLLTFGLADPPGARKWRHRPAWRLPGQLVSANPDQSHSPPSRLAARPEWAQVGWLAA